MREGERATRVAAFAISTQGLSPLVGRCRDARTLPAALSDFLFAENLLSGARARRLLETLVEHDPRAARRGRGGRRAEGRGARVLPLSGPGPPAHGGPRPPAPRAARSRAGDGGARRSRLDRALRHAAPPRLRPARTSASASPATEDPENPIRLEIHTSFRLPVLGARLRRERGAAGAGGDAGPRRHARRDRGGAGAPDAPPLPRGRGLRGKRDPGNPGARFPASRASARRSRAGDSGDGFFEWKKERTGARGRARCSTRPTRSNGSSLTPSKNSSSNVSLARVVRAPTLARGRAARPALHAPGARLDAHAPVARGRADSARPLPPPHALPDSRRGEGERRAGRVGARARRGVAARLRAAGSGRRRAREPR